MSLLSIITRALFRTASITNTANILASGSPKRIATHVVRRTAMKHTARLMRRLLK